MRTLGRRDFPRPSKNPRAHSGRAGTFFPPMSHFSRSIVYPDRSASTDLTKKGVRPMEEKKLVERLQKRSRSALERAIDRYTPYVGVTVWRVLGGTASREDLEEVVSDVFLSLWLHAGELDADQGLRPGTGPSTACAPAPRPCPSRRPTPPPAQARRRPPATGTRRSSSGVRWRPWASRIPPSFSATTTMATSWATSPPPWASSCPPPVRGSPGAAKS